MIEVDRSGAVTDGTDEIEVQEMPLFPYEKLKSPVREMDVFGEKEWRFAIRAGNSSVDVIMRAGAADVPREEVDHFGWSAEEGS